MLGIALFESDGFLYGAHILFFFFFWPPAQSTDTAKILVWGCVFVIGWSIAIWSIVPNVYEVTFGGRRLKCGGG